MTADYYVNMVRTRSKLDPKATVTMADVKKERRLELAFEFDRYFDLVRWGDAATVLASKGYNPVTEGKFPIPLDQIISSGYKLNNNPGY